MNRLRCGLVLRRWKRLEASVGASLALEVVGQEDGASGCDFADSKRELVIQEERRDQNQKRRDCVADSK